MSCWIQKKPSESNRFTWICWVKWRHSGTNVSKTTEICRIHKILSLGNHYQPQKKEGVIFEHQWTFLSPQKKYHTLLPDTYLYPFELALPGHLAESIDINSFGSLSYKLKATLERPAFLPNLIHRKQLWVMRQRQPWTDLLTMPIRLANTWADRLSYTITLPQRTYRRGQDIPIEFSFVPHRPIQIRYLSCFLKEYGLCGTRTQSRIIRFFCDDDFSQHWHKSKTITVPSAPSAIQVDAENVYFKIYHKLKFTLSVVTEHRQMAEIRSAIPIEVVDSRVEEEVDLPAYEHAWQSIGLDLGCIRLPSYHTINLNDGLPAYEL